MGQTRAKFRCVGVTKRPSWRGAGIPFTYDAEFQAVTEGSDENKRFFAATPSGNIKISTLAVDAFEPGEEYYVDFVPAPCQ